MVLAGRWPQLELVRDARAPASPAEGDPGNPGWGQGSLLSSPLLPTHTGGSELLTSSSVRTICLGEFFFGIL